MILSPFKTDLPAAREPLIYSAKAKKDEELMRTETKEWVRPAKISRCTKLLQFYIFGSAWPSHDPVFLTILSYIITRSPVVPLLAVTERYMNQKIWFISDFVHYVTRFQTAATEQRPDFRPKWLKNATRKGGTSPYFIIREYPPGTQGTGEVRS